MRTIHRHTTLSALVALLALATPDDAQAQYVNSDNRSYGMYLPAPVMPNGHDEVRAADGTTCRSAVAGNGPVLDFGGIGNQNRRRNRMDGTVYGRVVVPLGKRGKRLDCTSLYQVELDRLRHELEVARSALRNRGAGRVSNDDFAEGWTDGAD